MYCYIVIFLLLIIKYIVCYEIIHIDSIDISTRVDDLSNNNSLTLNEHHIFNTVDDCVHITSNLNITIRLNRTYHIRYVDLSIYNNESVYNDIMNMTCFSEYFENTTNYIDGYYIIHRYHDICYYLTIV